MQILCRCIELTDSIAQKTIRKKQSRQSHITSQAVGMEIFAAFPHHALRRQFNLIPTIIRRKFAKARVYLHFAQSCSYTTTTLNIPLKSALSPRHSKSASQILSLRPQA